MDNAGETALCALAIGGLDPSGGAGLPADARAMAAFGVHCCGVATAVIAQNTCGVNAVEPVSPAMLGAQLDSLLQDITPRAVKIGMIPSVEAAAVIIARLNALREVPIILDTVFAPSSGAQFATAATIRHIANYLLPLVECVTPNIPEATQLYGQPITDRDSWLAAAAFIHWRYGARNVLIKGGHWPQPVAGPESAASPEAVDILFDGERTIEFSAPYISGYEVRGTGCLLASAIAAQRAHGVDETALPAAVQAAKSWLTEQIRDAKTIGRGRRVVVG